MLRLVSLSTLMRVIQPMKVVGGGAFLVFGLILVRVKYYEPTVDLGKVFMNSTLN